MLLVVTRFFEILGVRRPLRFEPTPVPAGDYDHALHSDHPEAPSLLSQYLIPVEEPRLGGKPKRDTLRRRIAREPGHSNRMFTAPIHSLRVSDAIKMLETSPVGLATGEAEARRALYGSNTLVELPPEPGWKKAPGAYCPPHGSAAVGGGWSGRPRRRCDAGAGDLDGSGGERRVFLLA